MDPRSSQQREMSFPIRTKENTPFSVASNTPRPMPPMRDLTAGEWYAIDPKAFEAAIIMMNISAEDKKFGKTHDDDLEEDQILTVEDGELIITEIKRQRIQLPRRTIENDSEVGSISSGEEYESEYSSDGELPPVNQEFAFTDQDEEEGGDQVNRNEHGYTELPDTNQEFDFAVGDEEEGGYSFDRSKRGAAKLPIINEEPEFASEDEEEGGYSFDRSKRGAAKLPITNQDADFAIEDEEEGGNSFDRPKRRRAKSPPTIQEPDFEILDDKEGGNLFDRIKRRGRRGGKLSAQERQSRSPSPTGYSRAHLRRHSAVAKVHPRKQTLRKTAPTLFWNEPQTAKTMRGS